MSFVTLPQALFVFYGALVLSCGIALGIVVGRNWSRRAPTKSPDVQDELHRRVALLEQELEVTGSELRRVINEREFMRDLRSPRDSAEAA